MYLALLSVAFGSILNIIQAASLFMLLGIDQYVACRAVLNTMNVAAPFLCLGFDIAAPSLKRRNEGFPFLWNLTAFHALLFIVFVLTSLILSPQSKSQPIALGLAGSTSIASALTLANLYRTEGNVRKYFLNINIIDKLFRTIVIIGVAVLVRDITIWAILVSLLSFSYVGSQLLHIKKTCRICIKIFMDHLRVSFPFIFSSLGIVVLTRMPFYIAYIVNPDSLVAKIDIGLLFSLFLLIPMLNRSKVEEATSCGIVEDYLLGMKKSWRALALQELLVITGIAFFCGVGLFIKRVTTYDLLTILFPLVIGMAFVASVPNYIQLICFKGHPEVAIKVAILTSLASSSLYLVLFFYPKIPVTILFVLSALTYCAIGGFVAKSFRFPQSMFWRWPSIILNIIYTTLLFISLLFLAKSFL